MTRLALPPPAVLSHLDPAVNRADGAFQKRRPVGKQARPRPCTDTPRGPSTRTAGAEVCPHRRDRLCSKKVIEVK